MIFVVEEQCYTMFVFWWVRACARVYPPCNAYAPYYVVMCGLCGSTKFFDIFFQAARFSERNY